MAIDQPLKRKRGRPEGGGSPSANKSQRDKMVMEQKMALVHRRLALLDSESDKDADVLPTATMDDKLAAVVDQQSVIINWNDIDDEDEDVPLRIVRPQRVDSEQKKLPDVSQTHNAQDTDTAEKKRRRLVNANAKSNMEQKLKLSTPRLAICSPRQSSPRRHFCPKQPEHQDSTSAEAEAEAMAIDQSLKRKRGKQAGGGSPSANKSLRDKMVMERKMALVHRRLALLYSESDKDADVVLMATMDDKIAAVVDQQPVIIQCDDMDDEDEHVPLRILWPRMVDSEQKKLPDVSQTHNAQDTDTAEKKRRRLVNANAKCNMEQKLKLSTPRLALFKSGGSNNTKSDIDDDLVPMIAAVNCQKTCASIQGNFWSAMERAEEVLVKLPAEHPSFVKHMLHSHVVQGFWLGLPSNFCNKHLPKTDTTIVLEDEDGHIYDAKYLGAKQGLSAGWRGFAINHDIKVGDVVVFQLVSSAKFKVYILRANKFTITDGALGLLCLDAGKEKMLKEVRSNDVKPKENRKVQSDSSNPVSDSIIDGIRFSDTAIDFDHVKNFSNFNIIVDGLVIDCKFPDHLRRTYYELCCAQESFLHKDLLKQINLALAVGVIMETINIAEGIRAARASSHQDFLVWKKTLEAFQLLGMNVEFLLKRIDDLLGLPARPRDPAGHEEKKEMKLEHARAEAKMKELESRMSSVKNTLKKMDVEMEEMESSAKRMEMWLATAAPW